MLLDLAEPPTAIFAFNDNHAIGAIQAARARGIRVPEDLSIVGFDDVEHATIVTPTLTTVRQPLAEMGRTAVSLLTRLLERQSFETLHVELATRLVVRESSGPVPRAAKAGSSYRHALRHGLRRLAAVLRKSRAFRRGSCYRP